MTVKERARKWLDVHHGFQKPVVADVIIRDLLIEIRRLEDEIVTTLAIGIAQGREEAARIAEVGSFLHNDATEARMGKAVAAAIRRSL